MSTPNYAKLWSDILESSVWCEPNPTRILWITMMAMADSTGYVRSTVPGLAGRARITLEEAVAGLEKLLAPDPWSATKDYEGRRIVEVERGWKLLNFEKMNDRVDVEEQRARNRERQERFRDRRRGVTRVTGVTTVTQPLRGVTSNESNAESRPIAVAVAVEEKANCIVPPSPTIPLLPTSATAAAVAMRTEMDWRVEEVWRAHLKQWAGFFTTVNGKVPTPTPTLTKEIRGAIRDAIAAFDKHLLGAEQRDQWKRESKARAAGIGIFFDPWCTGTDPRNNVNEGGKRFLEHWRPWKKQAGKGDPVERFSELYFEVKSRTS